MSLTPDLQGYFVNPETAESSEDLARLASIAVMVLAGAYETQGDETQLDPELQQWLATALHSSNRLEQVVAELLQKQFSNRRFDQLFMGQIHPQGNKVGILANMIGAFMNTNTVVQEVSPVENELEDEVLTQMAQWFGYDPDRFGGNIVSGGTTANLAAMWASREKAIARTHENIKLFVLGTEMAHYSVAKATDLLGPNVTFVPVELDGFKTSPESVLATGRQLLAEHGEDARIMSVIGLAGETETGDIDDLERLADVAEELGADFHVDAAYGGPYVLSRVSDRFRGIKRATSITIDPHKMLYVPYSAGAILFKDRRDLMLIEKNMRDHARYLLKNDVRFDGNGHNPNSIRNFGMSRVEGSMGSGGVLSTWSTLKLLGEEGVAELLNHTLDLTEFAHQRLQTSSMLRPIHQPEINTQLIGLREELQLTPEQYNLFLNRAQREADKQGFYVSYNEEVDHGRAALRMVIMHPHTSEADVTQVIEVIETLITSYLSS